MIHGAYIANQFREHRVLFGFAFLILGLLQVLIITVVAGMDMMGMVEQFMRQLPPQMQMIMGEQFLNQFASVEGAVAYGYNHPLVLVMMLVVAILLPARHVAGEIETGTMELLLALPVRRPTVVLSLQAASALALLVVVAGGLVGSGVGVWLNAEARGVSAAHFGVIAVNLWLLALAVSSYTLLIAAYAREGGKAVLRATGLTLVFYFLRIAALMWAPLHVLQPLSVFYYHEPQKLLQDPSRLLLHAAVLGAVIVVCTVLALRRMSRRDIPG